LAGTAVPAQDETKHFKLIGTTGTGKSTAIHEIMASALSRGDRAVIADPDGGYLQRFYRPDRGDVVLNPFDPRSVKWDLFSEIKSGYDVEQLARSLIPDHEGQDRSWRGYARTFFTAVTRQAHQSGTQDVDELYRLLVVADRGELRELVRGTPAQPFLDEDNSRMFDSIRSVTSSAAEALEYIGRQQHKDSRSGSGSERKLPASCSFPTRPDRSRPCARPSRRGCVWRSLKRWTKTSPATSTRAIRTTDCGLWSTNWMRWVRSMG